MELYNEGKTHSWLYNQLDEIFGYYFSITDTLNGYVQSEWEREFNHDILNLFNYDLYTSD